MCPWKSAGNRVEMELDLSPLRLAETAEYTGGMGIRIDNTGDRIQSVTINWRPHFAFSERVVILPNLKGGVNRIVVALGPEAPAAAHVTYVSKRMPSVERKGGNMEFRLLTKAKGRFSLRTAQPAVLLNADAQSWDRKGDRQLHGHVNSDRTLVLTRAKRAGFGIAEATLPILAVREAGARVSLTLQSAGEGTNTVAFRAAQAPKAVALGDRALEVARSGINFEVTVPPFSEKAELRIDF